MTSSDNAGYLSFGPIAQSVVHALKGLACRTPVLLAHVEVTRTILFFQWVQNLGTPPVSKLCLPVSAVLAKLVLLR
jgi:hypothetical protein